MTPAVIEERAVAAEPAQLPKAGTPPATLTRQRVPAPPVAVVMNFVPSK